MVHIDRQRPGAPLLLPRKSLRAVLLLLTTHQDIGAMALNGGQCIMGETAIPFGKTSGNPAQLPSE
jgi:hypothetical protein